jgi:hypothetical protein
VRTEFDQLFFGQTKKLKLKMIFKTKVPEGCKIRRTCGILGYTRRDKLFISLALEFFTRSRGGSFQPRTHLSAPSNCHYLGSVTPKMLALAISAAAPDGSRLKRLN